MSHIKDNYNNFFRGKNPLVKFGKDYTVIVPCTVTDLMGETYGKYPLLDSKEQIIMEYNQFFPYVLNYMP